MIISLAGESISHSGLKLNFVMIIFNCEYWFMYNWSSVIDAMFRSEYRIPTCDWSAVNNKH